MGYHTIPTWLWFLMCILSGWGIADIITLIAKHL